MNLLSYGVMALSARYGDGEVEEISRNWIDEAVEVFGATVRKRFFFFLVKRLQEWPQNSQSKFCEFQEVL